MKGFLKLLFTVVAGLLLAQSAFAQGTLRGKVTDQDGAPLPGVTVLVKGTTQGTMTGADGTYSMQASKGSVIEFSCLGLATQEHTFDGRTPINIQMTEDALYLDDVVVVGYGTAKKETLTAAVSAIKGDELLKAPATNVSQVLAGKLSGISSVQESGEPGLDQASLRIRGSVYGVAYVVDGFPVSSINDIDPADIESISVLKDGASAAVYGLKAAGGVIVVTTRKGNKGDTRITYNGSVGASMNANFPQFMNGPQFAYYYNVAQMMDQLANGEIASSKDYVPYFTQKNIQAMREGRDGWDNVDYVNKVFGTGLTQKHNVTIQGGTDKARFFTSVGIMDQKGNIDRFNYRRYNIRSNIEGDLSKHLSYKVGISGVLGNRSTPAFLSGGTDGGATEVGWFSIARQTVQMHPYLPVMYDGYYTGAVQDNQSFLVSPLAAIYESGYKKNRSAGVDVNAALEWRIPWAVALGNHDSQFGSTREEMFKAIRSLPGCVNLPPKNGVYGCSNDVLTLSGAGGVEHVFYLFDSMDAVILKGEEDIHCYDYIRHSQIAWYRAHSERFARENGGAPVPSMAFFHIPLCELPEALAAGVQPVCGNNGEPPCPSRLNSGLFAQFREMGDVKAIVTGHDHDCDYVLPYGGINFIYGRFSGGDTIYNHLGPNGYIPSDTHTAPGTVSGCRVFRFTAGEPGFRTWVRLYGGEIRQDFSAV